MTTPQVVKQKSDPRGQACFLANQRNSDPRGEGEPRHGRCHCWAIHHLGSEAFTISGSCTSLTSASPRRMCLPCASFSPRQIPPFSSPTPLLHPPFLLFQIRQHHWFLSHLPRYLAVPPPTATEQAKRVCGCPTKLSYSPTQKMHTRFNRALLMHKSQS